MKPMPPPVRRALLSVSDKTGLIELARELARRNIEILSSGGTAQLLTHNGVPVREVADYTGFPEIMDGRVKTLQPKIHGGLLGRRGVDDAVMAQHAIAPIDLLVVNLYPFAATVARPGCRYADAVENIDIGGPAMLRAAAKNHESVLVVVDPADYPLLLAELDTHQGGSEFATRARLAAKAFSHTARYDALVAGYLSAQQGLSGEPFPATLSLMFEKVQDLRYGENPHQSAALYRDPAGLGAGVAAARLLQGKDPSYNNIADADTAVECVRQFTQAACVIVKHANPCGVAVAATPLDAYEGAYRTDPTSAYGGIIAFNRELDAATATAILELQFVEVLAAPAVPTRRKPTDAELADLRFAWAVCKFVKSNAIVFARAGATIGVGAGQMSRVYSTRLAAMKATDEQLTVAGSVMASDAFLPFRDNLDVAAGFGICAVIQPGGSKRDAEVIAAADQHGMAMVFTGMRHFRH